METPKTQPAVSEEPTLPDLIACVERELRLRRRVYLRLVNAGKMDQEHADFEIACMRALHRRLLAEAQPPLL